MDNDGMRVKLGELRTRAEEMLKQLGATEAGSGAEAWGLLGQFASAVEGIITRSGESGTRASLERFFNILPPDSVRVEFDRKKAELLSVLQSQKSLSDVAKPYELFIRHMEEPDLEWPDEESDAVEGCFGRRLTIPLYGGKYSFTPSVSAKDEGGIPPVASEGNECVPSAEPKSIPEEESAGGVEVSRTSENEVSERQDGSTPEIAEPEAPDIQEILRHFEISTQKTESGFSVKTFTKDYFFTAASGEIIPRPNRYWELKLICWFAKMGALTKIQIEKHLFDRNIGNIQVERLYKNGYVSIVRQKDSDVRFYALSAKGADIFKKTSRDLMKNIISSPPSSPLNCESELAQMYADIDAYQHTATVALRFYHNSIVKKVERIRVDFRTPVILLRMRDEGVEKYLVVTGVSKKVLLLPLFPDDYPSSRAEQDIYLRRLAGSACSDAEGCEQHYCTVSDSHTAVECFDTDGNGVDIDKYIESHVRPAPEDDQADQMLDTISLFELVDIIGWFVQEPGKFLGLKEFVKRLKQYTPKDDMSDEFKRFVEGLKRVSAKGDRILRFKKFVEDSKQKLIQGGDGRNIVPQNFIESLRPQQSSVETAASDTGDADNAAGELPSDGGTEVNSAPVRAHNTNPFDAARQILDKKEIRPADEKVTFDALVSSLLDAAADSAQDENTDYIGRAVVLLKSLAFADDGVYGADYRRLLLATDMPLDDRNYSMEELSTYFSGESEGTALHLAALLRALFLPASRYEYALTDYARELFKRYDKVFDAYSELKGTLGVFIDIADVSGDGFTDEVVSRFVDEATKSRFIKGLGSDAAKLCQVPHINQRFNGVPEMLEMCFGQDSELGLCMSGISENRESDREFISKVYGSFVDGGKASPQKMDKFIDECWKEVRHSSKKWIRNDDIVSTARQKIDYAICQRLEIMNRWLAYADSSSGVADDSLSVMYSKTKRSLESAVEFLREDTSLPKRSRAVLSRAVKNLSMRLSGKQQMSFLPEDWLSAGFFAVTDGLPVINDDYEDILYYERWRNALRHIAEEPARDLLDVLTKIESAEDPLYDNLGQAIAVCEYLGIDKTQYRNSVKNAREAAEKHLIREFEEKTGIDFAYGRIGDQSKETAVEKLERMKPEFFERNDFAGFRRFLTALRGGLNDEIAEKRKYWESAILERRKAGSQDKFELLERAAKQLERGESSNFILVEESLNLFDDKADPSRGELDLSEKDLFSEFITEKKYNSLEDICKKNKSASLRSFAEKFVKDRIRESSKYKESALRLLQSLPNGPEKNGCEEILTLLTELGFVVSNVTRDNPSQSPAVFTAKVTPDQKNAESYKHPIAEMGTNMGNTLSVVELFGGMEPRSIIEAVSKSGSRRMSIVLLNGYLTLAQRRQLAGLFLKDGNAQTPFILADRILLLHLAQKYREDRLHAMLACAMPYTGCHQLFSANSVMPVADEMYMGRMEEIRQITDKNGPVFVYGGRQLGKTAVLLRAKNVYHAPKNNDYGVYADVKDCHDEISFVTTLTDKIREADPGFAFVKATIKAMCDEIREWLLKSGNKRLLLLIDESDNILSTLAEDSYAALNEFEQLSKETGRFKFVFAGLHNVFSAAKDSNTVFGHFGKPICIRPLSQSDAYKLLARPLRYLGFNTDPDTLLPLLVNTNFYPGVVHFVGTELVKMLIHRYSSHYNESDNPPYRLDERQIGSVMHSANLSDMIEERIKLTLDVDIRYFMLARCIAALYYEDARNRSLGYDVDRIMEYAALLEIDALRNETKERCENLLSEMCDMSLLVNMTGRYRFRQSRFLNIVGKDTGDIIDQIARVKEGA
ncbi:MAG: hypothetical protein LBB74_01720 [Chitinispirillales bacterium]|jgi:hypothetical protein|nr:hypothetical protein [Chitinispirillales bacterium]